MRGRRRTLSPADRFRAWLVTGSPGRGIGFAIDFSSGLRQLWRARRGRPESGPERRFL